MEEGVEDFEAEHGDELMGTEGLAEIDGEIRGGEDLHADDVAVDEVRRYLELVEHAEWDGSTAGLSIGGASLEEEGLNTAGSYRFGGRGSTQTTANHGGGELQAMEGWAG